MDVITGIPTAAAETIDGSSSHALSVDDTTTTDATSTTSSTSSKKSQGIILLTICILVYTLQSIILKAMNSSNKYQKPFFVLWLSHSTFVFILPISLIYMRFNRINQVRYSLVSEGNTNPQGSCGIYASYVESLSGQSWSKLLWITFGLSILYTLPNYLWYLVLSLTSISEATTIFNTNCVFAYIFSIILFKERLKVQKVIGIILSIAGIILIAIQGENEDSDDKKGSSRMLGNLITLVAAVTYGFYEVLYEKYAVGKSQSVFLANQVTAWIGVFTLTTQWTMLPILHYSNNEPFELPPNSATWALVLINALLSFTYNAFFMLSIALAGPVLASVGLMVTIPLSWFAEFLIWNEMAVEGLGLLGSIFIIFGFGTLLFGAFSVKPTTPRRSTPNQQLLDSNNGD